MINLGYVALAQGPHAAEHARPERVGPPSTVRHIADDTSQPEFRALFKYLYTSSNIY